MTNKNPLGARRVLLGGNDFVAAVGTDTFMESFIKFLSMMRSIQTFALLSLLTLAACQKQDDFADIAAEQSALDRGKGGNNNTSGFIAPPAAPADPRLVGGDTTSIGISFTQPAPPGGWTVILTSTDPALQVPTTYFVPEGSWQVNPVVPSLPVSNFKPVGYTVTLNGQSVSNSIKLYPAQATFQAPQLSKPGKDAKLKFGLQVTFDWSDNLNAWYHELQISHSPTFETLWDETGTTESFYPTSYLASNTTHYWRVRFVDASGNPGPWSEVRSFFVKPQ